VADEGCTHQPSPEINRTSCDVIEFLGVCEIRRKLEINVSWRYRNTDLLGKGEGQRNPHGIGVIMDKNPFLPLYFPRVGVLLLRLDSNKTLKIVKADAPPPLTTPSDDDEVEEFYSELESPVTMYPYGSDGRLRRRIWSRGEPKRSTLAGLV
ncbi:unnamed protein product, partial [Soboliphyme baturini]|uniref:MH2 domain-containing protein n=1 Tax=Soboliphyme baturini TaxID=241478 RepID=A0A183J168_9BILA